jgi:hypothetical protein
MPVCNLPSVKTLQRIKDCGKVKAQLLRECMSKAHLGHTAALANIDAMLGTYGVEYIPRGNNAYSVPFYYCNTGETYETTVLYFPMENRFRVGSWGDRVERGRYD